MKLLILSFAITAQAYTPLIVGGNVAQKNEAPYIVSLQDSTGHACGGSLIAPDVVLTAAHCTAYAKYVVIGNNDLKRIEKIKVSKIIKHPKYNPSTMQNDVAVIYLSKKVANQKIELCDVEPQHGDLSIVYGWGATKENGFLSKKLMKVEVPIVSKAICNAPESYNGEVLDSMLCAGLPEGGKDSCQGDSGGPLVVQGKLCGVVSWGYGCARPNLYGVYADVFNLKNWILNN